MTTHLCECTYRIYGTIQIALHLKTVRRALFSFTPHLVNTSIDGVMVKVKVSVMVKLRDRIKFRLGLGLVTAFTWCGAKKRTDPSQVPLRHGHQICHK